MKLLKTIQDIPPSKNNNIVVIGKGPSVDKLNLKALNSQKKYDILTINDACRIVDRPTYSLFFHIRPILRSRETYNRAKYILLGTKNLWSTKARNEPELYNNILNSDNSYYFVSRNRSFQYMISDELPKIPEYRLYHHSSSVSGAVYFLAGLMGYKNIKFIGFDGGTKYGKKVDCERLLGKIYLAQLNYLGGWLSVLAMLKVHYPEIKHGMLEEFLL